MDEVCLVLGGGVVEELVPGHRGVQLSAHVTHAGNNVQIEDKNNFLLGDVTFLLFYKILFKFCFTWGSQLESTVQ